MISLLLVAVAMTVGQCEGGQRVVPISVGHVDARLVEFAPVRKTVRYVRARKPLRTVVQKVVERKPIRSFFRDRKPARKLLGLVFGRRCRR